MVPAVQVSAVGAAKTIRGQATFESLQAVVGAWSKGQAVTDPQGNSGSDGFQAAQDSLSAITQQNNQLQQQIASGQLIMNPDAANKAAQAYDTAADSVNNLIPATSQLQHVSGLGSYPSGSELTGKFRLKATNPSKSGAADLLAQLHDELKRKAELFRQACKDYQTREEQITHDMGRVSQ